MKSLPSPALAIAGIALFCALGGTGYAATKLAKNSVTSSHVKNESLTGADVRDGSLTTDDIRNGGAVGEVRRVDGPKSSEADGVTSSRAECPEGFNVIGGGHNVGTFDSPVSATPYSSFYSVISVNHYEGSNPQFMIAEAQAFAVCARTSGSDFRRRKAKELSDFRGRLARAEDAAR